MKRKFIFVTLIFIIHSTESCNIFLKKVPEVVLGSEQDSAMVIHTFYKNKRIKSRTYYKNGQKVGMEEEYYSNGNEKVRRNYKFGLLEGHSIYFYKKKKRYNLPLTFLPIKKIENYSAGKKDGEFRYYFNLKKDSLNLISEQNYYKKDTLTGAWFVFYRNGNIRVSATYLDGKLNEYLTHDKKGRVNGGTPFGKSN